MLTLSSAAADRIATAREQSGIPDEAHLRIAPAGDQGPGAIGLGFVEAPFSGDQVGDAHGVSFCVAPELADELAAVTLDLDDDGTSMVLVPSET
ncbi:MAG: hypothetical protein JK586_13730 [Nocardiopsis sp. BM-2018]|nr:MAG: hypothetical protein JK586_13730 [Nocardiopsis sp. BM-2018]